MSTTEHKALELADRLQQDFNSEYINWDNVVEASAGLRRLSADNEALRSTNQRLSLYEELAKEFGLSVFSESANVIQALRAQVEALTKPVIQYTQGKWFMASSIDEMQAFFESRLPAIRATAYANGYAIGVHGSMRRDLDLIAAPWREGAADAETLAHAIARAACGIDRDGAYNWEQKPFGRIATSLPICWVDNGVDGAGHIDLSVVPQALTRPAVPSDDELKEVFDGLDFSTMVTADDLFYLIARAVLKRFAAAPQPPGEDAVTFRGIDDNPSKHALRMSFEAWWHAPTRCPAKNSYQLAWEAWQAAAPQPEARPTEAAQKGGV